MMNKTNAKTKETIEKIHNRVKNFVNDTDYKNYLLFIKKFRNRSFFNQMLIYITKDSSLLVQGYKQWIDKFNRIPVACITCRALSNKDCECKDRVAPVRIPQFAPITYTYEDKAGEEQQGIWFKVVFVFDISDTEPLPDLPVKEVYSEGFDLNIKTLDVKVQFEILEPLLKKMITDNKFTLEYQVIDKPSLGGWTNHSTHEIVVKDNTTEADKIHTLLHEIGHMFAHSKEELGSQKRFIPRIETEAETIAFVVADFLGIDTSPYSVGYITSWSKGDEEILSSSVETISKISNKMIDELERLENEK